METGDGESERVEKHLLKALENAVKCVFEKFEGNAIQNFNSNFRSSKKRQPKLVSKLA